MAGLSNDRGGEAPDERHRKVTSGEAVDQKLRNFGRLSSGPRMVGSAEPISPSHVFPKRYTALRVMRPNAARLKLRCHEQFFERLEHGKPASTLTRTPLASSELTRYRGA
jgi:hypothetical protein